MSLFTLFLTAIGLSMDAFAVSICKGLSVPKATGKQMLLAGLYFGGFQGLMPLLGWLCGAQFEAYIVQYDHWIAFVLLAFIGGNMLKEALSHEEDDEPSDPSFSPKVMLPMAVATSIDALAVGVSFAFLQVDIFAAVTFIGITTFLLSALGVKLGNVFGAAYQKKAELAGGLILVAMGTKILLEHLGIL